MKLLNLHDIFSASAREAKQSEQRRAALLAEAAAETERIESEREVLRKLDVFQKRLLANEKHFEELKQRLDPNRLAAEMATACFNSVAVRLQYPRGGPLPLPEIAECQLLISARESILDAAKRFCQSLETEVERFIAEHADVLKRHGVDV